MYYTTVVCKSIPILYYNNNTIVDIYYLPVITLIVLLLIISLPILLVTDTIQLYFVPAVTGPTDILSTIHSFIEVHKKVIVSSLELSLSSSSSQDILMLFNGIPPVCRNVHFTVRLPLTLVVLKILVSLAKAIF